MEPASGDLARLSAPRLFYLLASGDQTGTARFALPDREISLHFRKGNPDHVASTHPEDAVEPFLLAQGEARPEQLAQAEAAKARFGGEVVAALFGLGLISPATAFPLLIQHAQNVMLRVFLASSGGFSCQDEELPPSQSLPFGNRWAVLADLVRRMPAPEVKQRLADVFHSPVIKSGGRVALDQLRLAPRELRTASHFDGVRSLAQLIEALPQEADGLMRVTYLLREVECVTFGEPAKAARTPSPDSRVPPKAPEPPRIAPSPPAGGPPRLSPTPGAASGPPRLSPAPDAPGGPPKLSPTPNAVDGPPKLSPASSPAAGPPKISPVQTGASAKPPPSVSARPQVSRAPPPSGPSAPPDFARDLAELRARAQRAEKENLFEILGVPENANGAAVKIAYFKLAKQLHPDTVPPGAPQELSKLKADLFSAVGEAYRRLADDKGRAEYLEELKVGASEVDISQILAAEESFQKGSILVKARRFDEAVAVLEEAIRGNPDEGEFYAWRGYARFFTEKDRNKGKAIARKDLDEALRRNDRCAPAHYFLGQISKLTGDSATAARQFQKALEIDPQHHDAQRELRLLGRR